MSAKKRHASAEHITRVWKETKSAAAVAQRIGYSLEGTYRALARLGLRKYTRS